MDDLNLQLKMNCKSVSDGNIHLRTIRLPQGSITFPRYRVVQREACLVRRYLVWSRRGYTHPSGPCKIPSNQVHDLGVLLDLVLSMENQISAVARSAFFRLQLIAQLQPFWTERY